MNAHKFSAFHLSAMALLSIAMTACNQVATPVGTPITSLADSGPGSLRELLAAAQPGDTLRFGTPGTVKLAGPISLSRNVTLLADGVTFDAGGKGRALEVTAGANVTVRGGTLTNGQGQGLVSTSLGRQATSKATWGGLMLNRGTLTLDGVTLTGGTANNGGAIYNSGTLTLKGVTMTGNTATIPTPDIEDESTGSGGAIANTGILTIESGTFKGNTAYYSGGAIRHSGGQPTSVMTIKDGLFENNSCTYPNRATGNALTGADGCVGGALLVGNNANIQGGTFRGNFSTFIAGAMFVASGLGAEVSVSGGTFENNKTTGTVNTGGGAILNQSKLLISGGTFKGNSSMNGGAINLFGSGSLTLSGGTFEGNSAARYGGALQVNGNVDAFEMTGGILRGNTAGRSGGGINSDLSMSLTGGSIENNTAGDSGGGLNFWAPAGKKNTVTLGGTLVVQGNKAGKYGGGITIGSADPGGLTVNVQGASIKGNTASDSAGGIYLGSGAVLNLLSGSIADNTAVVQGGGIAVDGTFQMTGGSVTGNSVTGTADGQGGGGGVRVYAGAQVIASGGTINDNSSTFGAGVFTGSAYQTRPAGRFTLAGATVSGNKALKSVGGGFFNDGELAIQSGNVTGNTAINNGGGVFNTKVSTFTKTGGSVTGNAPDDVFQQ